jgi:hypothetical protein
MCWTLQQLLHSVLTVLYCRHCAGHNLQALQLAASIGRSTMIEATVETLTCHPQPSS